MPAQSLLSDILSIDPMIMDFLPEIDSSFWKAGRLKTYETWPFQSGDDICNPERMAAAGFYVVGDPEEPDLVQCFICRKQLDGWEPNDDPWSEHVKHQPLCPLVLLNKLDETTWTVQDLFNLIKEYTVQECLHEFERVKTKMTEESTDLANQIPLIYQESRKTQRNKKKFPTG